MPGVPQRQDADGHLRAAEGEVALRGRGAVRRAPSHAKNLCTSCHSDITDLPHPDNFTRSRCPAPSATGSKTEIYLKSDHGQAVHKGVQEAASCKDCHGNNHELLNYRNPQSPVYRANFPRPAAAATATWRRWRSSICASGPGRQLREERPRHCAAGKGRTQRGGLHRLPRLAQPAPLHQPAVEAVLAERSRHLRQMPRKRRADLPAQRSRAGGQGRGARCARLHRLPWRAHDHRRQAGHVAGVAGQHPGNLRPMSRRAADHHAVPVAAERFATYMQSFHGLALQGGNLTAANCASCHGVHDILPASDPLSTINPKNLPADLRQVPSRHRNRLSAEFFRIHAPPGAAEGKPWMVNFISLVLHRLDPGDHRRDGGVQCRSTISARPARTSAPCQDAGRRTAADPLDARPALRC